MPVGLKNTNLLYAGKGKILDVLEFFKQHPNEMGDKERSIYNHAMECASYFDDMAEPTRHSDPLTHVKLEENWQALGTELQEYISDRNVGQNRGLFLDSMKSLRNVMTQQEPVYRDLLGALKRSAQLKQDYAQGLEEERMNEQFRRTGPIGHAPSMEELSSLSATDTPMDIFFDRMLWMATMDFRGSISVDNYTGQTGNFLKETFNRLNNELADAPMERQMEFLERWNRHTLKTRDLANDYYRQELGAEPVTKEQQKEATKKLALSPLYENCEVMKEWSACFNLTWLDSLIVYDGLALPDMESKRQRSGNIAMGDLLNTGMTHFLNDNNLKNEVSTANAARFSAELTASGMASPDSGISRFAREFDKLLKDNRDASPSFANMRDSLRDFARLDHRSITDPADYRNKLDAARKSVQQYLDEHQGTRHTDKGRERQALAGNFREILGTWNEPALQAEAQPDPGAVYDRLAAALQPLQQMGAVLRRTESAFSRDSEEFKSMKAALEDVNQTMQELPDKASFTAEMAKNITEKLEKLGVTSRAYHDAKAPQEKNERRQLRFDLSARMETFSRDMTQQLRQTGDPRYSLDAAETQARHALAGRMMGVIADLSPDQRQFFSNPDNVRVLENSRRFSRTIAGMTVSEMQSSLSDRRQVSRLVQNMLKNGLTAERNVQQPAEPQRNQPQRDDSISRH